MPAVHETAYPRLKHSVSDKELQECYTPTPDELALAADAAKSTGPKICLLVLLKVFQRLGYFVKLHDVPKPIAQYVSLLFGVHYEAIEWEAYDESGTRRRHVALVREYLNVRPFDKFAQERAETAFRLTAEIREDLADLVNAAIEELIRLRYELPAYRTLLDSARRIRIEVNHRYFQSVLNRLDPEQRHRVDDLLLTDKNAQYSLWESIKVDPGAPTIKEFRRLVDRLKWLKSLGLGDARLFVAIPPVKVRHFALEACSLDAARMADMEEGKCCTLVAALIHKQISRCLDDLGDMIIRKMRRAHTQARQALADYQWKNQPDTDQLVALLGDLLHARQQAVDATSVLAAFDGIVGDRIESLLAQCRAHAVHAERNYLPFLWKFYQNYRQLMFSVISEIELCSTLPDSSLCKALSFMLEHRKTHKEWLTLPDADHRLSLNWVSDKWWKPVTGRDNRNVDIFEINRRYFEMCLFTETAQALQNGDLIMLGSEKFGDYREQFVSPDEYASGIKEYCRQTGLPAEKKSIVKQLRDRLKTTAREVDASFPENEFLRIENGEPILRKLQRMPEPEQLRRIERLLTEAIQEINILDALVDTNNWLRWTNCFGPLSGYESKLDAPTTRQIAAVFGYGCFLGPSQTARSIAELDRRQIAWINQRHITEEKLDEAITLVINGYNCFRLPGLWGSGRSASADGMKWDMYEQNLLSEYHIRYGGYGGLGYYIISSKYIALFSHFNSCGVREATYILDGLSQNRNEIQPDIIHSDTHGQTAVVFGLAYLLGIKLMPRIKNWKHLEFCRPQPKQRYKHIDTLFTANVNWKLIEDNLDEMLRVALSIKAGKLLPSTILRRLGSYSRHNRLYLAFHELGLVIRSEFLLNFISDLDLRRTIQVAMNKSERFNQFAQWVGFGSKGIITENDRAEQRKRIKYNHLVANCLIFHNVHAMTTVLHRMISEGIIIKKETLRHLSPYITEHINRFGVYEWNQERVAPPINYDLDVLSPQSFDD